MSFYLRKGFNVGPLRFNLSKSGIGVSAGIPGLRFGSGPRGNYVHMGRGGLYYRSALPQFSEMGKGAQENPMPAPDNPETCDRYPGLREIESADVSHLVDASSKELLEELNKKQRIPLIGKPVAIAAGILFSLVWLSGAPTWFVMLFFLAGAGAIATAFRRDKMVKTVVLFYEFDQDMENAYAHLHSAGSKLASCAAAWHIAAASDTQDKKRNAGANRLVARNATKIEKTAPPFVQTNIETLAIGVGEQTLHFFPDRVLVYDKCGVGAVGYRDLKIKIEEMRFIEEDALPKDAEVVDQTWKYLNKKGTPDRRFKDNRELPICKYEQLHFTSQSGLNEMIQVSKCGHGELFSEAISTLAKKIPEELPPATICQAATI